MAQVVFNDPLFVFFGLNKINCDLSQLASCLFSFTSTWMKNLHTYTGKSKAIAIHPTIHMHIGILKAIHAVAGNFGH